MDELELVRDLYGEPPRPDPAVRARVRARWEERPEERRPARGRAPWAPRPSGRARGRGPGRRGLWAAPLAGAVATLAAVLFAYGLAGGAGVPAVPAQSTATALDGPARGTAEGTSTVQGRAVLLAAAATAASEPPPRGTYWRVSRQSGAKVTTLWVARDGRAWIAEHAEGTAPGTEVKQVARPFTMAGRALSLTEIERLPAGTDALKRRVAALLPPGSGDGVLADAGSGLLWGKPAPPAVRAAAYRLLAELPSVRYLGRATDPKGRPGEAFAFTPDAATGVRRTLVVDPASSQVLSSSDSADGTGRDSPADRDEIVLTAGWTDEGPP
ncbi:hypothetical protein MTP10_21145 [Nonomuraea sp. 3-1Str]|uniref:hypothetical protein n=1 Tax=Nonomuraea sp. 3-1Str TaxID=2929801 RepID=UPI002856B2E0|nr:hypothetical protein [Nonomuraea sp. 3-1Str]MDR8411227.1 hypothetical protein [Nonomuraea sp. 3-1Str]